jgi:predicted ATPase
MSFARLWHRQGRLDEARNLLSSVYDRFTEGFETTDLKAATRLLDELNRRANPG